MIFVEAYTEDTTKVLGSIPLLFFSIILSYTSLAYLLNITEISVEDDLLTVRHGPIPWRGCAYRLSDCRKFFADKIPEDRATTNGVRINFVDDSFTTLTYTRTAEEAEIWAATLNEKLKDYEIALALKLNQTEKVDPESVTEP
jgi:hypothetical protein